MMLRFRLIKRINLFQTRGLRIKELRNVESHDVIVIGGGHAGIEASAAAARLGCSTLLITAKESNIGELSCNPSMGGIGKGILIREIDALDGVCGRISDLSGIHFRVLNRSNGPAVHGPRVQIDRDIYKKNMLEEIKTHTNLKIKYGIVEDIVLNEENNKILGIKLDSEQLIQCKKVIITTGTFLRGEIHIGLKSYPAGRIGESPTSGLSLSLIECGFELKRLKTGTPPRLSRKSICFDGLIEQPGEIPAQPFSFLHEKANQIVCYQTRTNQRAHDVVVENKDFNVHIKETVKGPRYCPSIESKVLKFGDKTSHIIWLEPEGLDSDVIYPNGISMTMNEDAQLKFLRLIKGFEKVEIIRPGYGVEYDHVDPKELFHTLETKKVEGLFLAGQINGTTGYEEAASQGIIAGINAGLSAKNLPPFIVSRSDCYIGVLIDDLVTKGVEEPYRIFTSRSEYRLSLRPDNADFRLTQKGFVLILALGYQAGCVSSNRFKSFQDAQHQFRLGLNLLKDFRMSSYKWAEVGLKVNNDGKIRSAYDALRIHGATFDIIYKLIPLFRDLPLRIQNLLWIEANYEHFIQSQNKDIEQLIHNRLINIPPELDYKRLGLSDEDYQKLNRIKPLNLEQASNISGVSPTGIIRIMKHLKALQ